MPQPIHCLVVRPRSAANPRDRRLLADAHALGLAAVTALQAADLYFIEGELTAGDQLRLAHELLSDPLTEAHEWRSAPGGQPARGQRVIEVALRPGVTDPVAEQIVRGAAELGVRAVQRAATGQRFVIHGRLTRAELHRLARGLLANPIVQHYTLGEIAPSFPEPAAATDRTQVIPVRALDDEALLALSQDRRAALDLAEMRALQAYFAGAGRDPTDVEFETIAQTWSEHCVHKTFKAKIRLLNPTAETATEVDGLLRTYIRAATEQINAPWVRSAFVDNAGILDFDDEFEVSFKL